VASVKSFVEHPLRLPRHLKEGLSSYGVDVIDNVYLGGLGERELVTYVKRALGYVQ
jgi:hypothetical protein